MAKQIRLGFGYRVDSSPHARSTAKENFKFVHFKFDASENFRFDQVYCAVT